MARSPIRLPPLSPRAISRTTAIRTATTNVLSTNTRIAVVIVACRFLTAASSSR